MKIIGILFVAMIFLLDYVSGELEETALRGPIVDSLLSVMEEHLDPQELINLASTCKALNSHHNSAILTDLGYFSYVKRALSKDTRDYDDLLHLVTILVRRISKESDSFIRLLYANRLRRLLLLEYKRLWGMDSITLDEKAVCFYESFSQLFLEFIKSRVNLVELDIVIEMIGVEEAWSSKAFSISDGIVHHATAAGQAFPAEWSQWIPPPPKTQSVDEDCDDVDTKINVFLRDYYQNAQTIFKLTIFEDVNILRGLNGQMRKSLASAVLTENRTLYRSVEQFDAYLRSKFPPFHKSDYPALALYDALIDAKPQETARLSFLIGKLQDNACLDLLVKIMSIRLTFGLGVHFNTLDILIDEVDGMRERPATRDLGRGTTYCKNTADSIGNNIDEIEPYTVRSAKLIAVSTFEEIIGTFGTKISLENMEIFKYFLGLALLLPKNEPQPIQGRSPCESNVEPRLCSSPILKAFINALVLSMMRADMNMMALFGPPFPKKSSINKVQYKESWLNTEILVKAWQKMFAEYTCQCVEPGCWPKFFAMFDHSSATSFFQQVDKDILEVYAAQLMWSKRTMNIERVFQLVFHYENDRKCYQESCERFLRLAKFCIILLKDEEGDDTLHGYGRLLLTLYEMFSTNQLSTSEEKSIDFLLAFRLFGGITYKLRSRRLYGLTAPLIHQHPKLLLVLLMHEYNSHFSLGSLGLFLNESSIDDDDKSYFEIIFGILTSSPRALFNLCRFDGPVNRGKYAEQVQKFLEIILDMPSLNNVLCPSGYSSCSCSERWIDAPMSYFNDPNFAAAKRPPSPGAAAKVHSFDQVISISFELERVVYLVTELGRHEDYYELVNYASLVDRLNGKKFLLLLSSDNKKGATKSYLDDFYFEKSSGVLGRVEALVKWRQQKNLIRNKRKTALIITLSASFGIALILVVMLKRRPMIKPSKNIRKFASSRMTSLGRSKTRPCK